MARNENSYFLFQGRGFKRGAPKASVSERTAGLVLAPDMWAPKGAGLIPLASQKEMLARCGPLKGPCTHVMCLL